MRTDGFVTFDGIMRWLRNIFLIIQNLCVCRALETAIGRACLAARKILILYPAYFRIVSIRTSRVGVKQCTQYFPSTGVGEGRAS